MPRLRQAALSGEDAPPARGTHTVLGLHRGIYEEHLDEAAFLWEQWERSLGSSRHVLSEVAEEEERLRAHLDGLVLGGRAVAEELLVLALESDEGPRVTAAAFALLEGSEAAAVHECLLTGDALLVG